MLNLRRPPASPGAAADDGYLACYGIVVATASLLLLTILAATVSIVKAFALAGGVCVAFGLAGCLSRWCASANGGGGAAAGVPVPPPSGRPCRRCTVAVAAIDALPAFAYTHHLAGDDDVEEGGGGAAGRRALLCAVCLEDVQAGEMVRRMPACRHLFHVECVDMWLDSHSTCPLCRCDVWAAQPPREAKPSPEAEAIPPDNALPPV